MSAELPQPNPAETQGALHDRAKRAFGKAVTAAALGSKGEGSVTPDIEAHSSGDNASYLGDHGELTASTYNNHTFGTANRDMDMSAKVGGEVKNTYITYDARSGEVSQTVTHKGKKTTSIPSARRLGAAKRLMDYRTGQPSSSRKKAA